MSKTVIVRYGELALKSDPVRRRFERCLVSAIKLALDGSTYSLGRERGRIFVETRSPKRVGERLSVIPGVVSVSVATRVPANMDEIRTSALRVAKKVLAPGMSFAVRTSRIGKHDFRSKDVNVEVGSDILSNIKGVHVDLSSPDRKIFIKLRGRDAYLFTEVVRGVGGLPLGTQGKVVALFSGNRNDVAAAYLMTKRGSVVFLIYPDPRNADKLPKVLTTPARKLGTLNPRLKLWVLPFKEVLDVLKKTTLDGYAYCIYKRSVLKAADAVAGRVGGEAIVTGDDAKQIATQKLVNLSVMDEVCEAPVLRPLAGFGGVETEGLEFRVKLPPNAKEICPFPPPKDVINLEKIHELEEDMKVGDLVRGALQKARIIRVNKWT